MKILSSRMARYRRAAVLASHGLLAAFTFWLACLVRFEFRIPEVHLLTMMMMMPFLTALRMILFLVFGLHRRLWSHAGIDDLVRIVQAVTLSTLAFLPIVIILFHGDYFPRSVFVIDWALLVLFMGGERLAMRVMREGVQSWTRPAIGQRTLIVGAGDAGIMAAREIRSGSMPNHQVVGFVDDSPSKQGNIVHGISILGTLDEMPEIVRKKNVAVVLIAIPSLGQDMVRRITEICVGLKIRLCILPAISDLISGKLEVQRIREVQVEDLLARERIHLDRQAVKQEFAGQVVMVTGAGGSIGSELARQIAGLQPAHLVLLDQGESALFAIDLELAKSHPQIARTAVVGNVADKELVGDLFRRFQPQCIVHAAAYKHVPLLEACPNQAVLNNVRGTRTLAEAAAKHEAKRFVMVSTDKAVRPGNIMGATKRLCELVVSSMPESKTTFTSVRFGNVLGSNGSVIPVFRDQIAAGGPVTVTHPDMTRYFMMIPEAVELVLQCATLAQRGDVYVLDMGTPVKIMELAQTMITLSGLRPGEDITIKITGLRPGEKIHEELVTYGEEAQPTDVAKVNVLRRHADAISPELLMRAIHRLEAAAGRYDAEEVKKRLWRMIALDQEVTADPHHPATSQRLAEIHGEWNDIALRQEQEFRQNGSPHPAGLSGRILVIDDDQRALRMIGVMLDGMGITHTCVPSGSEAHSAMDEDLSGELVGILCDYALLNTSGDELMLDLRNRGNHLPFAMMSGHETNSIDLSRLKNLEGYFGLLSKPFDAPALAAVLNNMSDFNR